MLTAVGGADRFVFALLAHNVACRRRRTDPLVQRHQEGRLGAAARAAGHADRLRLVHLVPAEEVIDAANAVPGLVPDDASPHQERSGIKQAVCGGAVPRGLEQLVSFTLADGVVVQGHKPVERHERAGALVLVVLLAVCTVPAGHGHGGERPLAGGGHIERCRYMVIGPTLKNDLLYTIALELDSPRDLCVERRLLPR